MTQQQLNLNLDLDEALDLALEPRSELGQLVKIVLTYTEGMITIEPV